MTLSERLRQRGVAALTVVMVLFFVMALLAAYTNRNLVFEQRISANSYRATRALEAADAGVEWATGMLNAGRITASCNPPDPAQAAGLTDFRSRYLVPAMNPLTGEPDAFGLPWGQVPANRVYPTCVVVNGVPRCACPALGEAAAAINVPADGVATAFRISFRLFNDDTVRGGSIQLVSRGCSNPGTGNTSCIAQTEVAGASPAVDSTTTVITTLGLVRALPVAPKATLTAGTTITANAPGELQIANGDFTTGLTAHAGVSLSAAASSRFIGPAGSGSNGRIDSDATLADLAAQGADPWFRALFVLDAGSYQRQPAVVRLDCAAGCNRARIAAALLLNPRNPIWADGDVDLDAAVGGVVDDLGTVADPMMLIVNGNLTISGDANIRGFAHANQINWTAPAATWDGALVSATSFTASSVATLRYDKALLDIIRLRYGSFVRAPGGWNLF
jgi:PilX N-terminal